MQLNYPMKRNGMYIMKKKDFDVLGEEVLREYMPDVLKYPRPIDVKYLATECLYLDVKEKYIAKDGSILGMIAFGDTEINGYDSSLNEERIDLPEGTIVIDYSLWENLGRKRYTLAHECSHWICHRTYHSPSNRTYEFRRNNSGSLVACRSENIEGIRTTGSYRDYTENDWEEWQADSLAAAILMPRKTFSEGFREAMKTEDVRQYYLIQGENRRVEMNVIHNLMEVFNVSYTAAEIRLKTLGLMREYSYGKYYY